MSTIKEKYEDNMGGHWDLRQGSLEDPVNGNHLSENIGDEVLWTQTIKGNALNFPGTGNSNIQADVGGNLNITTNDFTVVFVYQPTALDDGVILATRDAGAAGTQTGFSLSFSSGNLAVILDDGANGASGSFTAGTSAYMGTPQHVVVRFDRSGNATANVNGVYVGDVDISSVTGSASSSTLSLGAFADLTGDRAACSILEVFTLDILLSEQEASELYEEWQREGFLNKIPTRQLLPNDVQAVAADDLQAHWSMRPSGGSVIDLSGNGNDGAISGPVIEAEGVFGEALRFNGDSGSIDAGTDSSVANVFSGGGTMAFWIKPYSDGAGTFGRIMDKSAGGTGPEFFVREELGGYMKLAFVQGFSGTDGDWRTTDRVLASGAWHLVVVTYDSDSTSNEPSFYVNGQLIDDVTTSSAPTGTADDDSANTLFIGNRSDGARAFHGILDEGYVWDEALSAAQVSALYGKLFIKTDQVTMDNDMRVSLSAENATPISNSGMEVGSGSFSAIMASGSEPEHKAIKCETDGYVTHPAHGAFGTWYFEFRKANTANELRLAFMCDRNEEINTNGTNGYYFFVDSNEACGIADSTNGTGTVLNQTANDFISMSSWYGVTISRTTAGEFSMYIEGDGESGLTAVSTGSNPVTDTDHTTSSHLSFQIDSNDQIRNFEFFPFIYDPS